MIPIEVQLLRDWQPRSRPTRGVVQLGEGKEPDVIKLVPGTAAVGTEIMLVYIEKPTRTSHEWASARVALTVESMHIGEPRPVNWWLGYSDVWSGVIHYPVVASNDNLMFKGRHSILIRTVQ